MPIGFGKRVQLLKEKISEHVGECLESEQIMDEDVTNAERDVRMKSHTEGATPSVLLLQSPRAEVVISGPAERSSHRYMRENDCHRRRPPDGRGHSRSISGVLSSILSGISGAKTSACHPAEVAIHTSHAGGAINHP